MAFGSEHELGCPGVDQDAAPLEIDAPLNDLAYDLILERNGVNDAVRLGNARYAPAQRHEATRATYSAIRVTLAQVKMAT